MKKIGLLLICIGVIWLAIAFNMDVSVDTGAKTFGSGEYSVQVPNMKVNNLGLIESRRNHLLISGLAIVVGVLLFGFGGIIETKERTQLHHHNNRSDIENNRLSIQEESKSYLSEYKTQAKTLDNPIAKSCIEELKSIGYLTLYIDENKWSISHPNEKKPYFAYSTEQLRELTDSLLAKYQQA